jgi:hypothetical protein
MPDQPKQGGNVATKKLGPLPRWGWVAVAGGVYLVYRYYESYKANQAASAASGTTGGTTIPADVGTSSGSGVTSSVANFASLEAWEQAAISALGQTPGYSSADALNDISSWLNGSCVSATGYSAIGSLISNPSIGLPPGFSTVPTLSVCSNTSTTSSTTITSTTSGSTGATTPATTGTEATTTPAATTPSIPSLPNLPAALAAAMTNNGESVVDTAYDATTNTFLYLTNKGGVYALAPNGTTTGAVFYGSYQGLPAAGRESTAPFTHLTVNSDGSYTITNTLGQNYDFGPNQAAGETLAA